MTRQTAGAPAPRGQHETPYADAMLRYATSHPTRFHLPGHGGGSGAQPLDALAAYFGERALSLDLMPMMHGIDLGPSPTPLERSLRLAADAWGARRTWFLANGATQGNQIAAIALAGLRPGAQMLVQRSVHSSVIDALVITGGGARFVAPVVDTRGGMAHGLVAVELRAAIEGAMADGIRLSCVYIVSPSYFGFVSDIAALAEVAHAAGLPLVVDEAWGAHFGFHERLPRNALRLGADLVVSSTHKLGGSFTQSAMLHLGDGPFADDLGAQVDRARRVVQSTSESTLLLASLDLARAQLATGADGIARAIDLAEALRSDIRARGRFTIASDEFASLPGFAGVDPLRIAIGTLYGGINGHRARTILAEEHGILVEMATDAGIVALFAPFADPDIDGLVTALHVLPDDRGVRAVSVDAAVRALPVGPAVGPLSVDPAVRAVSRSPAVGAFHVDAAVGSGGLMPPASDEVAMRGVSAVPPNSAGAPVSGASTMPPARDGVVVPAPDAMPPAPDAMLPGPDAMLPGPVGVPVRQWSAIPPLPPWGTARMTVREAFFAPNEIVDAEHAIGRIAADALAAYPPGIPNVMPGEEITRELVEFVQAVASAEFGHVRGAVDARVLRMRVVAQ